MMGQTNWISLFLDEPTTNLDDERRKSLVKIISDAFREGVGPSVSNLIITHDAQILKIPMLIDIYRFVMGTDGSIVSLTS